MRERIILLDGSMPPAEVAGGTIPCPYLVPIDLSKGHEHEHPDFDSKKTYLIKNGGRWYIGSPGRVWFGWTFHVGSHCLQYDSPGWNNSSWEYVYEIHDGGTADGQEEETQSPSQAGEDPEADG